MRRRDLQGAGGWGEGLPGALSALLSAQVEVLFTESHFSDRNMGGGARDAGMSVRTGCATSRSRSAFR